MNIAAKIFLILWFSFLSAPTIINLLVEENSHAITLSITEEEKELEQKNYEKNYNEFLVNNNSCFSSLRAKSTKKNIHAYKDAVITVFSEIFIPPPELV